MLEVLHPFDFAQAITVGKTKPCLVTAYGSAVPIEVVAKFSARCEEKELSLAREVVSACLAGDLGLPVPQPYLLQIDPAWADAIPDDGYRKLIKESSAVAFGSSFISNGYRTWYSGQTVDGQLAQTALAVFAFDAMVSNPDRGPRNPNCLAKGNDIRIIDHELCFTHKLTLGWLEPWAKGGLEWASTPARHIFYQGLRGRKLDIAQICMRWSQLSDERLIEYGEAIPSEWGGASSSIQEALALIAGIRDNIEKCADELHRVLA